MLHGGEPRWAPATSAYAQWLVDPPRNPSLRDGEVAWFLARRAGRLVGRIGAYVRRPGDEGWFGFYDVGDDESAVVALLDAARLWLADRACTTITGPVAPDPDGERGVLTEGFEVPGVTGRQWHPPWHAAHLDAGGLDPSDELPSWRLDAAATVQVATALSIGGDPPAATGPYTDRSLVRSGSAGSVAAVPDLAAHLRGAGPAGAWALARRARQHQWVTATIVRLDGDPAALVPTLCAAAAERGYDSVIAPWDPDDRRPEAVHRLYRGAI